MLDVTGGELLVLVGAAAIFLGASDVGVGGCRNRHSMHVCNDTMKYPEREGELSQSNLSPCPPLN